MRPPCTVHRGAAASLLDQSALHGGFRCRRQTPARAWSRSTTLHHSSARGKRRARTILSATAVHRGVGASLLRSVRTYIPAPSAKVQAPARAWSWRQALSIRVPEADDEHAPFCPPPPCTVEQVQAARLASICITDEQRCKHLQVPGRGGKHSPPECQRQTTSTPFLSATAVHRAP